MKKIRLTKTDFMNGMRCGKMVWLAKHHPELRKLSAEVQARFDQGNASGDKAMGMFGEYEEMTTYIKKVKNKKNILKVLIAMVIFYNCRKTNPRFN